MSDTLPTSVDNCPQSDATSASTGGAPAPSTLATPQDSPTPTRALRRYSTAKTTPTPDHNTTQTATNDADTLATVEAVANAYAQGATAEYSARQHGLTLQTLARIERMSETARSIMQDARAARAHTLADEIEAQANGVGNADAKATAVRIDALKWLAGKLLRSMYGDTPGSVVAVQATGPLTVVMRDEGRGASVERARGLEKPADPAEPNSS